MSLSAFHRKSGRTKGLSTGVLSAMKYDLRNKRRIRIGEEGSVRGAGHNGSPWLTILDVGAEALVQKTPLVLQ